jgi:hypothetical protein
MAHVRNFKVPYSGFPPEKRPRRLTLISFTKLCARSTRHYWLTHRYANVGLLELLLYHDMNPDASLLVLAVQIRILSQLYKMLRFSTMYLCNSTGIIVVLLRIIPGFPHAVLGYGNPASDG